MCRSFVGKYEENGKEKTSGRFNLGVCTVALPYAALKAKGNKELFFKELEELCDKAYDFNQLRIERMKGTKASVAPILWMYGALAKLKADDTIDHLFYNGNATCSIGYAGLFEALEVIGDESKDFALEVLQFMKDKTKEYTQESKISYGLYGSPFESGCHRLTKAIKKSFPEWKFEREFITNSFHRPVFADINLAEKLDWEGDFYKITSSGNVNNVELPNLAHNIAAFEQVVRMAYEKVNYLIVNQPVDKCFECGFRGEFKATEKGHCCPSCGNSDPETATCTRRVSGYIHDALARPANKGKHQEQTQRTKHM